MKMTNYAYKLFVFNVIEPVVNSTERVLEGHTVIVVHTLHGQHLRQLEFLADSLELVFGKVRGHRHRHHAAEQTGH